MIWTAFSFEQNLEYLGLRKTVLKMSTFSEVAYKHA